MHFSEFITNKEYFWIVFGSSGSNWSLYTNDYLNWNPIHLFLSQNSVFVYLYKSFKQEIDFQGLFQLAWRNKNKNKKRKKEKLCQQSQKSKVFWIFHYDFPTLFHVKTFILKKNLKKKKSKNMKYCKQEYLVILI